MLFLTIAVCAGYLTAEVFYRKFFSRQENDNLLGLLVTVATVTVLVATANFFSEANEVMSFEIFLPILIGCGAGHGFTKFLFKR